MVGISDADQKFHPLIISIQSSEDGPGSALLLCVATKMVSISLAIPIRCLKDAAKALHYGASILQLIRTDCFAHQTRLPFQHGGGLCGSHGSLSRYLLSYKDEQMKKRCFILEDTFGILSYVLVSFTSLHCKTGKQHGCYS